MKPSTLAATFSRFASGVLELNQRLLRGWLVAGVRARIERKFMKTSQSSSKRRFRQTKIVSWTKTDFSTFQAKEPFVLALAMDPESVKETAVVVFSLKSMTSFILEGSCLRH